MPSNSSVFLRVGAKNTGKTTQTLAAIRVFVQKGRPVLVLNKGNQQQYDGFPEVELEAVPYWRQPRLRPGVWQCRTTEVETFLAYCNAYVRNAVICLEDVTPYFSGNIPKGTVDFLNNNRNCENDLIINSHSLGQVGPAVWGVADYLFLHHTIDNPNTLPPKIAAAPVVADAMQEISWENSKLHPRRSAMDPQPAWRLIDLGVGAIIGRSDNRFVA